MDWSTSLGELLARLGQIGMTHLPQLLVALAVLALGWGVGRLAAWMTTRLVTRLGRLGAGRSIENELRASGVERLAPQVLAGVAFWVVFAMFFAAAIEIAGLQVVTTSLARLVQYLPNVLAGVLVVLAGIVLGNLARGGLTRALGRAGVAQAELLGRFVRVAIVLVSVVIALDQIGIESTLLILTLAILLGTVVGGAALAFGLGARNTVQGLLAAHYVGQCYRPGDRVRVGDVQGRVLEFTRTAVVLDTDEGRALVPASEFERSTSVLLAGGDSR